MRTPVAIDTNVPIVANGKADHAGADCEEACIVALLRSRDENTLLLDASGEILDEYRRNLRPSGQPGLGDAFFKWIWDRQGRDEICRFVAISPHRARKYAEFPADPDLAAFDPSDRKFVAVVLADGGKAAVWNATDSDWRIHEGALRRNGIRVVHLCPGIASRRRVRSPD